MYTQRIRLSVPDVGIQLDGEKTLDENLADLGGLKHAFIAYEKHLNKHGREKPLQGLEDYSNEQLFFLAYAQKYCEFIPTWAGAMLMQAAEHSPGRYRCNEALKNTPEFAQAFKCKAGDTMNPEKRCHVW